MTAREVACVVAVFVPALRTAMVVVDRLLDSAARDDLSTRIETFRAEVERRCPELGEVTRGQALDAIESPGPTSAATALGMYLDVEPGVRARIEAGVELARRAAGVAA